MKEKKVQMCPLFPEMPCPRGDDASGDCSVRVNGNYDPVADFKDYLVMHCALHRAGQNTEQAGKNDLLPGRKNG